jgi:hypothetical protein
VVDDFGATFVRPRAGARVVPAFDAALTFTGPGSGAAMRMLLDDLEQGRAGGSRNPSR